MSKAFTIKSILSVLFFTAANGIFASNVPIECPPSKLVTASYAMLDTIHVTPKKSYVVYAEANTIYQEDAKRYWSISTMVGGYDFNDAFNTAIENVKSANVQWDKFAKKFDGYYCKYTGDDISRVVYLMTQDEGRGGKLAEMMSRSAH